LVRRPLALSWLPAALSVLTTRLSPHRGPRTFGTSAALLAIGPMKVGLGQAFELKEMVLQLD
jgi:hypothetical protein